MEKNKRLREGDVIIGIGQCNLNFCHASGNGVEKDE